MPLIFKGAGACVSQRTGSHWCGERAIAGAHGQPGWKVKGVRGLGRAWGEEHGAEEFQTSLPRRWIIQRRLAWIIRWRRLVRDPEGLPESCEVCITLLAPPFSSAIAPLLSLREQPQALLHLQDWSLCIRLLEQPESRAPVSTICASGTQRAEPIQQRRSRVPPGSLQPVMRAWSCFSRATLCAPDPRAGDECAEPPARTVEQSVMADGDPCQIVPFSANPGAGGIVTAPRARFL
jgi:hypothetical protein